MSNHGSNGHVHILVVEDNPTEALLLRRLLERKGYEVEVASDGALALEHLESNRPELIISDVMMPEMDGFELCRRVKRDERTKDIPVLLLTALSEPEDIIEGLDSGASNFLTKPADRDVLLSRIEYVLVNREIRKEQQTGMGVEIFFAGKRQYISSDRMQILDLLLATYEDSLRQKRQLEQAMTTIKALRGIIPICASCKSVRNDAGYWQELDTFVRENSDADFSHGICPDCLDKLYPDQAAKAATQP